MSSKPNIPAKNSGDVLTAAELNTIVDFFANKQNETGIVIQSVSDLSSYLTGDEYILPTGLVILNGTIDLGANAIRVSTGTVLRGFASATLLSTNTSGVVRATNIGSAVILREFNVVCNTGPCFVLIGTISHQLNMFFVGSFGLKAGTITGFDVQSVKQCFTSAANGFTFDGTTNKVFVSQSPFYGITGSAVTLASSLVASVADIVTSFFKFDSPGVGITAESGYTVGEGIIRGSLIDGSAVPLSGLSPSDLNWKMTTNSGISDSRIVGGFFLNTSQETVISAANTPVKVSGLTTGISLNQRFTSSNNRLTFTGKTPTVALVNANFAVASGNNTNLTFYVAKNGSIISESTTPIRVSTGGDERFGASSCLTSLVENDYIEIWVENNDNTANLTCLSLNLNASG